MSGLFSTNLRLVGVKKEMISGTPEDLLSADYDIKFQTADLSTLEVTYADNGKYMNGQLTRDAQTPGIVRGGMSLEANVTMGEFTAQGSSGSPTYSANYPMTKALGMAGFKVIEHQPTGLTPADRGYFEIYSTKDSLCSTATVALLDVQSCSDTLTKGIEYKLRGCSSNLVVSADEAGMPFKFTYDPQGGVASVEEVDYANIPVFNEDGANQTRSIPFMNADIIITPVNYDGSAITPAPTPASFCVSSFNLDFQNAISEIICADSQYGLTKTAITDMIPKLDVSVLMTALSEFDWWDAQTSMQIFKVEIIVYEDGAKTLKLFSVEIPRAQMQGATNEDSDGFRQLSASFMALVNSQGADEEEKQKDVIITVFADTIDDTTP